jgi:hypothetical protein
MGPAELSMLLPMLTQMFGGSNQTASQGGLLSGAGTGAVGLLQTIPSLINTIKLNRIPRPEYETLEGVTNAANRAEQRAQFGFSPNQTAAFKSNLANTLQADYRNARDMSGGGLAQAITSRNMGQRLNALNRFAADDATAQQRNIQYSDSMQKYLQGEDNRQTAQQINYRMRDEGQTGATLGSGLNNIGSYVNQNAALGNFGSGGFAGAIGGGQSGSYFPNGTDPSLGGFSNPNLLNQNIAPTIFGAPFKP